MVQINFTDKEMLTKVVYYGPGLCGKTTNLQLLHEFTDPDGKTKLFSINTEQDRTLFFDLLPLNVGKISGYNIKIQIYTVPGQVHYSSTRRAVLAGTDAVVFVCDSNPKALENNIESLEDLAKNLSYHGLDVQSIPLVLQYNKRDLPNTLSVEEMQDKINTYNCPYFEAVAVSGDGVLETFCEAAKLMVNHVVAKYRLAQGKNQANFGERVAAALEEYRPDDRVNDTQPIKLSELKLKFDHQIEPNEEAGDKAMAAAMEKDELVQRAVSANMELAQLYNQIDETKRQLSERVKQLESVKRIGEAVTSSLDLDRLLMMIGKLLGEEKKDCVCISLVEGNPPDLKHHTSYLLKSDPIFLIKAERGKSLAHLLAFQRKPTLVTEDNNPQWFKLIKSQYPSIKGLISFPLISRRKLQGLVNILTTSATRNFDESDLQFFTATSQFLTTAIDNARLVRNINILNKHLEHRVSEYNQLKKAFDDMVKERTDDFARANKALTKTTQEFLHLDEVKDKFLKLISQEVQLPLSVMAEEMGEVMEALEDEALRQKLQNAISQGNNIRELIQTLSDLLNLEQGRVKFNWETIPLAEIVRRAIRNHSQLLREKSLSVLTRLDAEVKVTLDPTWLERAFSNLVHNAAKFSPQKGKVKIWTDFHKNAVLVYFRDYGKGIPQEQREQAFSKYKVIEGSEYMDEGLGLGLPIAKEVAEAHQGFLEILNPPKSKNGKVEGSLLRFSLPIAE